MATAATVATVAVVSPMAMTDHPGGKAHDKKSFLFWQDFCSLLTLNQHSWTVTGHQIYKYDAYDNLWTQCLW